LGVAPPAARLGYEASTHANRFHQVHHEGDRHFEMGRGGVTRLAALDKADNAFTQIKRIGLRHHESPPARSESQTTPHRNPPRFNLRVRCSSCSRHAIFPTKFSVRFNAPEMCSKASIARLSPVSIEAPV